MSEPSVLYSAIQLDGGWRAIPGLETGAHNGAPIFMLRSGLLDFFDGTTVAVQALPFDYVVVGAVCYLTATLGTATSTLIIGTTDDTDHFVESTTIPMTAATTAAPIKVPLTLTATVSGSAGTGIIFTSGSGATTTGQGHAFVFVKPTV